MPDTGKVYMKFVEYAESRIKHFKKGSKKTNTDISAKKKNVYEFTFKPSLDYKRSFRKH